MFGSKAKKADGLHAEAHELMQVDEDAAIKKFEEALTLHPEKSESHYNLGLIYKYRGDWEKSRHHNRQAVRFEPTNEAANWNLAIAATALSDWDLARETWARLGIDISDGEGPIEENFGQTPVRLNPDDQGEVVWARRMCPVRARIYSIPFPESGFCYGDIVLHDGASTGQREWQGRTYLVFNVLELSERPGFETHVFEVEHASDKDFRALQESIAEVGAAEDWSHSIRILCRQCSEGTPHEHCDDELDEAVDIARSASRRVAVAVRDAKELHRVYEWGNACGAKVEEA